MSADQIEFDLLPHCLTSLVRKDANEDGSGSCDGVLFGRVRDPFVSRHYT